LRRVVLLLLKDWGQVDEAIRNVGAWLAAHDLNGDVILWPVWVFDGLEVPL
jgi:hypothetical protein